MLRTVANWFDDRTGYRKLVRAALYEPVPGGARWRYVWGSTLVVAFVTQLVTGVFLWMAYSPSAQTAWESVFYIQHEMWGGWLLRGIHHFMAHAMVYLLIVHFVQVVIDGAYRAPRELNFVVGLLLMFLVLGMALTGYLLPWDQKGYWATSVGTNLASQAPLVGPALRKLAIGGPDYGHHTLTRFFALHAGVLPGLMMVLLAVHIGLFRRHGLHAKSPRRRPDAMFWPDQVLKDSVAALALVVGVLAVTIYRGGAELGAPADPAQPYDAARPEGYFLFLFQFLKWFPGELELWGAFIIPGAITVVLFAMPWIGRTRGGHIANVVMLTILLGGAALLTAQAWRDDYVALAARPADDSPAAVARYEASRRFLESTEQAEREAERVIELAKMPERIPPQGALAMTYEDPYLQGPRLFRQHCASCHNHQVDEGFGIPAGEDPQEFRNTAHKFGLNMIDIINPNPTAPNLWGVGGRGWMQSFLNAKHIVDEDRFGYLGSPFVDGDMVTFIQDAVPDDMTDDERSAAEDALLKVADALWLAAGTAANVSPKAMTELEERAEEGWELINGGLADVVDGGMSCVDCHSFEPGEAAGAPNLHGYMSRQWMIDFIKNPAAEHFYGDSNDRMPAFAPHDDPRLNQLDEQSLELIVDWLRGDWRRP